MSEREDRQSRSGRPQLVRALGGGPAGAVVLTLLALYFVWILVGGGSSLETPLGTLTGPGLIGAGVLLVLWVGFRAGWDRRRSLRGERLRRALEARAPQIVVGVLVLVALGLRVWGSRFGEPLVLHPDETVVAGYAIRMLRAGSLSAPEPFHYPTVFLYLLLPAFGLHFVRGMSQGVWTSLAEVERLEFSFYHLARLHSAVLGTATVLLVFLVARRMWEGRDGRWAGAVAAALLCFSYVHVRHSHYAVTDVAMGFFVLVAFRSILDILDRADWRTYAVAGFLCGVACATKYSAAPVVVVLVAAHLLGRPLGEWLSGGIVAGLAATPLGFFVGYPSALLDWPAFLEHLGWLSGHSGGPAEESGRLVYVAGYAMESGMGPAFALMTLAAVVFFIHRRDRGGILAVVMMATTAALLTRSSHRLFARYLVPVLPFAALLVGRLTLHGGRFVEGLLRDRGGRRPGLVAASGPLVSLTLVALMIVPQALESIAFDRARSLPDTRALAREYVVNRFPSSMRFLTELRFLKLPRGWDLRYESQLGDLTPAALEAREIDVVIFSDSDGPPDPDSPLGRRRRRLRSVLIPVEVIESVPGENRGPTVRIFLRRADADRQGARPDGGAGPAPPRR